ncbi:CO or xanthine dehydrogenase, Mo-binding subunit [Bryocella elongata]|uniref:CO or xanthine dehydrogenase, Mo-binding subunit n=1 Tax=Bryocella elongata TaxID=863522 RepID=A0A1H5WNJ9_9BACT|nr:xanthine dehydrogenase family protein molybdopterin-binding subunit [Bryocella elongata]SEG01042.1 CO or xanthine dehydrogenase, Mo-binding subunit [Bryocella elongata]
MPEPPSLIGASPLRKEGRAKVLGAARYIDDIELPGMWHGATVRSTIARGRIRSITFSDEIDWSEYAIVRPSDIPGENVIVHLIKDHPCLADGFVNHPEEPILLIAHPSKAALLRAKAAIRIEYDPLPGVFTIEESEAAVESGDAERIMWEPNEAAGSATFGSANCFRQYQLYSGEAKETEAGLAKAFEEAAFIVEGEYSTGAQEQLYIENNGVIAECFRDEHGNIESLCVQGSMQCPYYLVHALTVVFNLPEDKCRVIQVETGGAFGGKEDFPSVIGSHAALLAMKCGHPVKIVYDRAEDMAGTTKRHPSRTRHRTALSKDGMLLGAEIEVALDGGAYTTLSPTVLSRATLHAPGPYRWPFLRVRSKAMATNIPPHGAFRGFGAPQALFGIERHMDRVAKVVGLTPEELRRRNFLRTGDVTVTGQKLHEAFDMNAMLTRVLKEHGYHEKLARFAEENKTSPIKRGVGFAAFLHGAGFTGSGERRLNSEVVLRVDKATAGQPARVCVLVSSTEFGQGTNTILSQVAAHTLGIAYDDVYLAKIDTAVVPNSGPTVASRTAMIVGKLVERASLKLLETLRTYSALPETCDRDTFFAATERYFAEHETLRTSVRYEPQAPVFWDDQLYRGEAYPGFAWAIYVAEVAVDMNTYQATCTRFDALQEVGRVLHPVLAKGQIEGGVAQGIGYAIYERCEWKEGRMMNNQMTNYIMPTSADLPEIHVHFEEVPSVHGPGGAKGIGELPMDGPGPAILNAIENATGVSFHSIPLLPEDIFERFTSLGHLHGGSEDIDATVDRDTEVEAPEVTV